VTKPRSAKPRYLVAVGTGSARSWYWRPSAWLKPHFADVALGKDRIEAQDEARRLNRQLDRWLAEGGRQRLSEGKVARHNTPAGLRSVGEMLALYQASEAFAALRDSTRAAARPVIRMIERRFADEQPSAVTRPVVRAWLAEIRARAPGTARQVGMRFRAIWSWAAEEELTALANPLAGLKSGAGRALIGSGGKRKARMQREDITALVATADIMAAEIERRWQAGWNGMGAGGGRAANRHEPAELRAIGDLLVLATFCCMRKSDALAARRGWFHWSGSLSDGHWRLLYRQSKSMQRGKDGALEGGRQIDMELPALVAQRLAPWLAANAGDPAARLAGMVEQRAARLFAAIRARARLARPEIDAGITLRDCRRSGFILYVLGGVTVELVTSISGHTVQEGYDIVEHYLPKTAQQADRAVAMLRTGT
jgi:hypothetical protein